MISTISVILLLSLIQMSCRNSRHQMNPSAINVAKGEPLPVPGGDGELIINEFGTLVENNTTEISFFQKKSDLPNELFRVYMSSDSYQVRQIRKSDKIRRRVDLGGDELAKEELKKFDLLSFIDDGHVLIGLSLNTGKLETMAFDRRVPRINDIAKLIQNDASRWNYDHLTKDGSAEVLKFLITYQIRLYPAKTRDEVKQMLQKKK